MEDGKIYAGGDPGEGHMYVRQPKNDPKIGEELADGRTYAGRLPKTNEEMFINRDGLLEINGRTTMTFEEAKAAMDNLAPFGWQLPSKDDAMRAAAKASSDLNQQRVSAIWSVALTGAAPPKPDGEGLTFEQLKAAADAEPGRSTRERDFENLKRALENLPDHSKNPPNPTALPDGGTFGVGLVSGVFSCLVPSFVQVSRVAAIAARY
jgi:hypothetical protein